jgi:molybdopterin converting factor small subunit
MITVRLPSALQVSARDVLEVHDPVATIAELVAVLDRRIPGLKEQLDDSMFNFAVNDQILLHHPHDRALRPGDIVEIVPAISGG